jgi:uncharacterized phage protein (TIGR01671 family)
MREIKFRAWDGKKMLFSDTDDFSIINGKAAVKKFCGRGCYCQLDIDFYEVQQFTGYKDRKGKEIYEGDIVKYTSYEDEEPKKVWADPPAHGIVIWGFFINTINEGTFWFTNDASEKEWFYGLRFYGYDGQEFLWKELEVIGNNRENKELLDSLIDAETKRRVGTLCD